MKMAPLFMIVRSSVETLAKNELRESLLAKVRKLSASRSAAPKGQEENKVLESTIGFSYDLLREINKLNLKLSEAQEPQLRHSITNDLNEMLSLAEVLKEVLVLYKAVNKETIDPLKKKLTQVMANPYQLVEV